MTGGMGSELRGSEQRGADQDEFIIVFNDNEMSISENVGGMSDYLARLRTADLYTGLKKGVTNTLHRIRWRGTPSSSRSAGQRTASSSWLCRACFSEDMGITYLGPVPGHDIGMLCRALREAKKVEGPVLLHVLTRKGKGYGPAEEEPARLPRDRSL